MAQHDTQKAASSLGLWRVASALRDLNLPRSVTLHKSSRLLELRLRDGYKISAITSPGLGQSHTPDHSHFRESAQYARQN